MKTNFAIIGMIKSINNDVARLLADSLGMFYLDTDEFIAYEYTMPVSRIVEEYGEEFFYKAESKKLRALNGFSNITVGVSSSALLSMGNIAAMKEFCYIVSLRSVTSAGLRLQEDRFNSDDTVYLKNSLVNHYSVLQRNNTAAAKKYADIVTEIDGLSNEQIVDKIIIALQENFV